MILHWLAQTVQEMNRENMRMISFIHGLISSYDELSAFLTTSHFDYEASIYMISRIHYCFS